MLLFFWLLFLWLLFFSQLFFWLLFLWLLLLWLLFFNILFLWLLLFGFLFLYLFFRLLLYNRRFRLFGNRFLLLLFKNIIFCFIFEGYKTMFGFVIFVFLWYKGNSHLPWLFKILQACLNFIHNFIFFNILVPKLKCYLFLFRKFQV